ncbi:MAG: hypothetical protein H6704_10660 [Myxococcales bacterium]|nr:hypothetical protein [Myxococcales bacterium]
MSRGALEGVESLLGALHAAGLAVGVDDAIAVRRLLCVESDWSLPRMRLRFQALLCRDAHDRHVFDAIFDALAAGRPPRPPAPGPVAFAPTPSPSWLVDPATAARWAADRDPMPEGPTLDPAATARATAEAAGAVVLRRRPPPEPHPTLWLVDEDVGGLGAAYAIEAVAAALSRVGAAPTLLRFRRAPWVLVDPRRPQQPIPLGALVHRPWTEVVIASDLHAAESTRGDLAPWVDHLRALRARALVPPPGAGHAARRVAEAGVPVEPVRLDALVPEAGAPDPARVVEIARATALLPRVTPATVAWLAERFFPDATPADRFAALCFPWVGRGPTAALRAALGEALCRAHPERADRVARAVAGG